jgi:hypothetical protein
MRVHYYGYELSGAFSYYVTPTPAGGAGTERIHAQTYDAANRMTGRGSYYWQGGAQHIHQML